MSDLSSIPVYAWASAKRPQAIHHQVKDLWLKVRPQQVDEYTEPLVLLEDVRQWFYRVQHLVEVGEDGAGQDHECPICGAEPGQMCSDMEGREHGRRVHELRIPR